MAVVATGLTRAGAVVLRRFRGRVRWQRLFEWLHRQALQGMNIGPNADHPHESGERAVFNLLSDAPVVLDVGANVGEYAQALLLVRPQAEVHCFEPSQTARRHLTARVGGRVAVHPFGLGARAEEVTLFAPEPGSGMASITQRRHASISWDLEETVELRRLDDLGFQHIDLLKVDVEGHELAVLQGAERTLRSTDMVQFEFGGTAIDARVYLRDFYELLGKEFMIYRVVVDGLVAVTYSEWAEVFVTSNFLAVRRDAGVTS